MPFTAEQARERLKKTYKNVSDVMARQFSKVFNKILKETGDESRAFAGAYAAINNRGVAKKAAMVRAVVMAKVALEAYEVAADKVAEIIGGTAKVWGHDSLLIEDAGPGIHLFFSHHGEVLEVEAGSGHPKQMVRWLENRVWEMEGSEEVKTIDIESVATDPFAFAEFLAAVFQSGGLRARAQGSKAIVAGRRDIVKVINALFDDRGMAAIQAYFSESGGATQQKEEKRREPEEAPEEAPEGQEPSEPAEEPEEAPEGEEEAPSDEPEDWDDEEMTPEEEEALGDL